MPECVSKGVHCSDGREDDREWLKASLVIVVIWNITELSKSVTWMEGLLRKM